MAYTIRFTDQINKGSILVEDSTINTDTSLSLPGRGATAYGNAISENFLHLLENFASNSPPDNPVEGQIWYDSTPGVDQLKLYDGTNWVAAGGVKKQISEPESTISNAGDLWVDAEKQQLFLYTGSAWVLVGPTFADGLATGALPRVITGIDNVDYVVMVFEVDSNIIGIVSTKEFRPKTAIPGFTSDSIKPGINLANIDIAGSGVLKYRGTAEKADALVVNNDTVTSNNFLRSDVVSTTNNLLRIKNDNGLQVGSGNQLSIGITGDASVFTHNPSGSHIDFKVNNNNLYKTILRLDSTTNVGINNEAPDEALDVTGNIKTSGSLSVNSIADSVSVNSGSITTKGGLGVAKGIFVGAGITVNDTSVMQTIIPDENASFDLGYNDAANSQNNIYWNNIYAKRFVGKLEGDVVGTITGRSSSAEKLASQTTFQLTGDVSAPSFTFDGKTGGSVKTFNTTISNTFVASQTATYTSTGTDELLINKTSGTATGLYKISKQEFLSTLPKTPAGVILPYGGNTSPLGWLLCDGREVLISDYSILFQAIGHTFKDPGLMTNPSTTHFALPDMRGRMPMGKDNMGGTSAARVSEASASTLGSAGGDQYKNIRKKNLPEHEHDLKAPNEDQFHILYDQPSSAQSDPTALTYDAPSDTGAGQALTSSGGVLDGGETGTGDFRTYPTDHIYQGELLGSPLEVVNPYLTLNYIIYTGV